MKRIAALILLTGICYGTFGQDLAITRRFRQISKSANFSVERLIVNPIIPDLIVYDKGGRRSTLLNYIAEHRRHKGKPLLLATTYSFCGGCVDIFNYLREDGLGNQFDIIVVLEVFEDHRKPVNLDEFVRKGSVASFANDFMIVSTSQRILSQTLLTDATPLFLFCDKDLKPFFSYVSSSMDIAKRTIRTTMELAARKQAAREKVWIGSAGAPVPAGDTSAQYYYAIEQAGNHFRFTMGTNDQLVQSSSFMLQDSLLVYDGSYIQNYLTRDSSTGKFSTAPSISTIYQNGRTAKPYTAFHMNGKPREENPVNGAMKQFDENGVLIMQGPVKDGVGEGVFRFYDKSQLIATVAYSMGKRRGPFVNYKNGKVISQGRFENDEANGLYQEFDENGKLKSEKFISPRYEWTGDLSEGLGLAKLNGRFGYIDRNGREVIRLQFEEAESFKDGKAKVKLDGNSFYINKEGKKIP